MRKSKENAPTKGGIKATIPHHSSIPLKQEYPLQRHAPPDSFKDKICTLFWLWVPCSSAHPPSFTLHSAHSGRRWRNKSRHQSGLASLSCCCVSSEPANWRNRELRWSTPAPLPTGAPQCRETMLLCLLMWAPPVWPPPQESSPASAKQCSSLPRCLSPEIRVLTSGWLGILPEVCTILFSASNT